MRRSTGYGTTVSARDLTIEYRAGASRDRHVAVRGVSFDLFPGEVLGVLGASGAGKSTLAMALAGLSGTGSSTDSIPDIAGGSLSIFDIELRGIHQRRRTALTLRVGYLPQDATERLDPRLTVAENVAEPIFLRDKRFDAREAGQAAATLIDAVHLPLSLLGRRPHELSGGQRQRVALARALVLGPELLVADEPLRGVDLTVSDDVLNVIPELQAGHTLAAVVVSSEIAVLAKVASRIAVLLDGSIVAIGTLAELVGDASHPYTKSLATAVAEHPLDLLALNAPRVRGLSVPDGYLAPAEFSAVRPGAEPGGDPDGEPHDQ